LSNTIYNSSLNIDNTVYLQQYLGYSSGNSAVETNTKIIRGDLIKTNEIIIKNGDTLKVKLNIL